MKLLFSRKTMLAVALAAAAAVGCVSQANEQPLPPTAGEAALPPGIVPGSQLAQVFKLVQAGLDAGVIKTFVANSAGAFELDADKIITLNDAGVPSEIINAMMERDKSFYAAATPPPAPPARPAPAVETAPPVTQVTVTYFNDTLSPYGSWVEVDGYGRCWRPTVVNYDSTWRPYCDRGHWVYTDCGWYWDSEYAWGSTFHYGRWFRNSRFGWCWYPDTQWAPSWVTFRSSSDYCGWAPLPPLAVFRPGFGFFYRGASVAIGFDFGLDAGCFTFVSPDRFCDRRPRYYSAEPQRVTQIFNQTTVINNYGNNNTTIVNNGISVQQISTRSPRPIQPVTVAALPNATRHGWRGEGSDRPAHGDNHANNTGNDNAARSLSSGGGGQPAPGQNRTGDQRNSGNGVATGRPASPQVNANRSENNDRNSQRDQGNISRKPQPQPKPVVGAPADNQGQTVYRMDRRNSGGGGDRVQPPQAVTPSVNNVAPERSPRQYNAPPNGNDRNQTENNSRNYREPPQPRQFNAPSAPVSSAPQNERRQNRGSESPVFSAPVARSAPQIEPRQFTPPPVQERVQERVQQREQRVEQRIEPRQSAVESAPRSYSPPPAPAPAPAPAPSQSRSSDRSSDRGSDRSSGHNSDKDKK